MKTNDKITPMIQREPGQDCDNCGRPLTPGTRVFDTDHGTCCTPGCAMLRIEDVEGR